MTSTVRNPCGLTLHDVSIQTKTKTIVGLMKQVLPANVYIKVNPGKNYSKLIASSE
jgi:Na+-translocating ferredoxin:NAD+ oxidoreductase RnfE subunit